LSKCVIISQFKSNDYSLSKTEKVFSSHQTFSLDRERVGHDMRLWNDLT